MQSALLLRALRAVAPPRVPSAPRACLSYGRDDFGVGRRGERRERPRGKGRGSERHVEGRGGELRGLERRAGERRAGERRAGERWEERREERRPTAAESLLAMPEGLVPEGWPRGPAARFEAVGDTLHARASDAALAGLLDKAPVVLLDGPRGAGKSAALLGAVVDARKGGAVAMYVPCAKEWTHGEGFFAAAVVEGRDVVLEGPAAARFYDRPTQTLALLEGVLRAHGDALDGMKCQVDAELREVAGKELGTVRDVVEYGVGMLRDVDADWRLNPLRGGDALDLAVRELSAQEQVPFVLAIDDYNAFVGLTALVNDRDRCVHANGLRAVSRIFGRDALGATAAGIKRGVVIAGLTTSYGRMDWRASRVECTAESPVTDELRQDPSGEAWLDRIREFCAKSAAAEGTLDVDELLDDDDLRLDPSAVSAAKFVAGGAQVFSVPEFTGDEAAAIMLDFESNGKMESMGIANQKRLAAISGGRGDLLHKLCMAA